MVVIPDSLKRKLNELGNQEKKPAGVIIPAIKEATKVSVLDAVGKGIKNILNKTIDNPVDSMKTLAQNVLGGVVGTIRTVGEASNTLNKKMGLDLKTGTGPFAKFVDYMIGRGETPEVAKKIFNGADDSWQTIKKNIDTSFANNPNATEFEKLYLGTGIAVLGSVLDIPFKGSGKALEKSIIKKVITEGLEKEEKEIAIRTILRGSKMADDVIEETVPFLMRATKKEEVGTAIKEGAESAFKKLETLGSSPVIRAADDALIREAKKYESADEFVKAQFSKAPEGGMSHRPSYEGMPPAYDLLKGGQLPKDVYTHPDYSLGNGAIRRGEKAANESWDVLLKIRNKPEAEITVYRASPKNELRNGDWITLSKEYAKQASLEEGTPVNSFKVKAKDVIFAGDDVNEFGFYPKSQLTDIWNKAQDKNISEYSFEPQRQIDESSAFLEPDELLASKFDTALRNIEENKALGKDTRGDISKFVASLRKEGLTDAEIGMVKSPTGIPLTDIESVKLNKDGTFQTAITKEQINQLNNYKTKLPDGWAKKDGLLKQAKNSIGEHFELPQLWFKRKGLDKIIYDPIIKAGREAKTLKTDWIKRFKKAGLYNADGWIIPQGFSISKKEAEQIQKYFISRQGRGFSEMTYDQLNKKQKEFVRIVDEISAETKIDLQEVAKRNGRIIGEVENYAPLYVSKKYQKNFGEGGINFLEQVHPSFKSVKSRVENPLPDMYELDAREVITNYIDGLANYLKYSDPQNSIRYLMENSSFQNKISIPDKEIIGRWFNDVVETKPMNKFLKYLKGATAVSSLGASVVSILKQAQTLIVSLIIDKSLPKIGKSKFEKDFKVSVRDLPSIQARLGDISLEGANKFIKTLTQTLTKTDKKIAEGVLRGLLDKEYNKILKSGIEMSADVKGIIEKNAQDRLDMLMGGYFKGQKPRAYRDTIPQLLTQFTYPTLSQLNVLYNHIYTAKGFGSSAKRTAEVSTALLAIAYMDNVYSNLSFDWDSEEKMKEDVVNSLVLNLPIIGSLFYSLETGQTPAFAPVLSNIQKLFIDASDNTKDAKDLTWDAAIMLGLPRQIKRTAEGFDVVANDGFKDSKGRYKFKLEDGDSSERIRTLIRGRYASKAGKEYINKLEESKKKKGKKKTTENKEVDTSKIVIPASLKK